MSSVRRSKRHRSGASVEPAQPAAQRTASPASAGEPSAESRPRQKRTTRGRAAVAVAAANFESREARASSSVPTDAPVRVGVATATVENNDNNNNLNKRRTRHNKTSDSPLRALEQPQRKVVKRKAAAIEKSATLFKESAESVASPADKEDSDDGLGYFWKYPLREHSISTSSARHLVLGSSHVNPPSVHPQAFVEVAPALTPLDSLTSMVGCLSATISHHKAQVKSQTNRITQPLDCAVDGPSARITHLEAQISAQTNCIIRFDSFSTASQVALQESRAKTDLLRAALAVTQLRANTYDAGDDSFVAAPTGTPRREEIIQGSESALNLLRMIEDNAKPANVPTRNDENERDALGTFNISDRVPATVTTPSGHTASTPRPTKTPIGILGRIGSAVKNRLFGSTPTSCTPPGSPNRPWYMASAPMPAVERTTPPGSPTPMAAPVSPTPVGVFTDALTISSTPVGQRTNKPPRKRAVKVNPLYNALMKGVEHEDKLAAAKWAKQTIIDMTNDGTLEAKRRRIMKTVLYGDLKYYPSRKPWEAGFGFPLDMDDDEVAPGWAVYESMVAELAEPPSKKKKTVHARASMDLDDDAFFDTAAAARHAVAANPRPSASPSMMFSSPANHLPGGNVFEEQQGAVGAGPPTDENVTSQSGVSHTPVAHNPAMGSFSVPDESDSEEEESAAPVWTQPPPPAPVPAHAPLPSAAQAGISDDEVSRQRSRLMKHTPARPSRLREATYPSPSILSDAGGEVVVAGGSPELDSDMVDTMPDADPLDLDSDILAAVEERVRFKGRAQVSATPWSDPILRYEEDSEEISPA